MTLEIRVTLKSQMRLRGLNEHASRILKTAPLHRSVLCETGKLCSSLNKGMLTFQQDEDHIYARNATECSDSDDILSDPTEILFLVIYKTLTHIMKVSAGNNK